MKQSRRNFLLKTGLFAVSAPILGQSLLSCTSATKTTEVTDTLSGTGIDKFGIQLWTVKEDMAKDPLATLKALSSDGYKQIESFGGDKGIFWGYTPTEFKKILDDLGLEIVSSHVNPAYTTDLSLEEEFKKLSADAASIGVKYLINPFPGELKTDAEWQKVAEGLNKQGQITKAAGLKTGYHNHHIEFLPTAEGSIPEELLLKGTDKDLVDFELDLYWNIKAGQQPADWFTNYADRYKLVHVKDLYKAEKVAEIEAAEKAEGFWPAGASTTIGNGRIDFPTILKDAKNHGVEYFIVEQERFDDSTPLQDVKKDAEYMKSFKFA